MFTELNNKNSFFSIFNSVISALETFSKRLLGAIFVPSGSYRANRALCHRAAIRQSVNPYVRVGCNSSSSFRAARILAQETQ